MRSYSKIAVLAAIVFLPAVQALSQSLVPPGHQATILARALAYDGALDERVGATLKLGIVYVTSEPTSVSARSDMLQAFRALKDKTIQDKTLEVVDHVFESSGGLERWIRSQNVDVIYMTPGLGGAVDDVISSAVEEKVILIAPVESYVKRGAPIGVVLEGRKPRILVNLSRAQEMGMELDPRLLQLAKLVR